MLIRVLRDFLQPYRRPLALVVLLQLVQTLATLYLPTLNADIIDNGVITGNTGYILHTGGVMLAVALVQIVCAIGAVYFGARTAMGLGRDLRQAVFSRVHGLLRPRGRPVRHAVADHQDDQRRAAGADAGAADVHPDGVRADHVRRRHHAGPQPGRRAVLAAAGGRPAAGHHRHPHHLAHAAAVPADAGAHRRDQQRAARADHRGPRGPGLRPRGAGAGPLRLGQQ